MADEKNNNPDFDPEEYRMSLGDHLEELRWRLLKGIAGLIVAAILCLALGERVVDFFCQPLIDGLRAHHLPAQLYTRKITDSFTVYMNVSLITALAMASPWIVYQIWQFIASGLYKHERKTVTKYLPFSLALMVCGMVFLYMVVLPITVNFLIGFTRGFSSPQQNTVTVVPTTQQIMIVPPIPGDPEKPLENQIWVNTLTQELKFRGKSSTSVVRLDSEGMLTPQIELNDYVDLVMILLVLFGLAFQMPLVVLAVAKVGIVDIETLKKARRIVYFAMAILSAVIVPDVVTGMLALMVPLILLYEFGILLAKRSLAKSATESTL